MNFDNITIRSRNPMYYIDDQYQIVELSNTYDDEEIIEIKNRGGTAKVPINKKITIIPALGIIMFRTKDDALLFSRMLSHGQTDLIKENIESQGITKDNVLKFSSAPVKNGLYSIEAYDKGLLGRKDGYCALTKNNERYHISQVTPGSNEDIAITEYINRTTRFDYMNFATNKIIFELLYQNGQVYVTSYTISSQGVAQGLVFISDLDNYRVFDNKHDAVNYQNEWKRDGEDHHFKMQEAYSKSYEKYQHRKQIRKETQKKVFNIIWGFVWGHKGQILGKGLEFIKGLAHGSGDNPIESKILDLLDQGEVNIVG